ncbi:DUF3383 family protein [Hafnia alvei]|nr:DUF3383 family protein [Hafnia alvei]MBI0275411.1 DUF3383 family protein [Hafnia alvei]PNK98594.1 hypothetical protein CEQ28_013870 [Hafnia alvei]
MSIPISDIISVAISVAPSAVGTDGFGPLLFASPQFVPVTGEVNTRVYTSMSGVEDDFPDGEIYAAASAYYGQTPKPKTFVVCGTSDITDDNKKPATCVGGAISDIDTLKAITDGTLILNVSSGVATLVDLDFSQATDLSDVLDILQSKAFTANFSLSADGVFSYSDYISGTAGSVDFASGDVANALSLTKDTGAYIHEGTDGYNMAAALTSALNSGNYFYFVALDKAYRDKSTMIDACDWCQSNTKVFGYTSNDANMLVMGAQCQAANIYNKNYSRVLITYSASEDEYPECSILGRASTVNFNGTDTTLVLAFKKLPSITTADISPNQLSALRAINGNAFIKAGSTSIYMDGKMADGTWFDTVQGTDWLENQIQTNVFNLFYQSTTKIPFTDSGVSLVNAAISNALRQGVTNGLIAPGYDTEGTFYQKGYKVTSVPISQLPDEKTTRIWSGSSFKAIGAGALQGATIDGTFVQ